MYGHLESLLVLLNHKATINCRPNGKAAIHIACEMANTECLKILCNHGAKLNCFSMSGLAPLHFCTTRTSMPCAQQLILRGKVKLWSISRGMARYGGHDVWFRLGANLSKDMCSYSFHLQLTHVFILDSFSPSLWSEEASPILIPNPISPFLSLATGPYSRISFPFQCLQPTAWSVPQQKSSSETGSFYFSVLFLSSSSQWKLLRCFHMKVCSSPLLSCSNFLDLSKIIPNNCFFETWPWKTGCSFSYCLFMCQ